MVCNPFISVFWGVFSSNSFGEYELSECHFLNYCNSGCTHRPKTIRIQGIVVEIALHQTESQPNGFGGGISLFCRRFVQRLGRGVAAAAAGQPRTPPHRHHHRACAGVLRGITSKASGYII